MTYATKDKANAAIEAKGFKFVLPAIMGAACWVNGSAYAWVSEVWSPKHQKYRYQVHTAGAA